MAPPPLCKDCRTIVAIWVFVLCPLAIYCVISSGISQVGVEVSVIAIILAQCLALYLLHSSLRGTAQEADA